MFENIDSTNIFMPEKFVDIDKEFSLVFTHHFLVVANYLCKTFKVLIPVNTNHSKYKESLEWHLSVSVDLKPDYAGELTGAQAFGCGSHFWSLFPPIIS